MYDSTPRDPPHSQETERAVLASVLINDKILATISGRLVEEDFFSLKHQLIYRAMLHLQQTETPVDLRTLQARLEQQGQIREVGGIAYLASLDLDLPDTGRVEHYVDIIKERSVRRRLIEFSRETIENCQDGGMDAAEAVANAERTVYALGEETFHKGFQPLSNVLLPAIEEIEERPGATLIGVPSGFVDFDRITHGLNRGNLLIIAGRPGMGKTSIALNICQHVAFREKRPVGIFSLEMSAQELSLRILCSEANVSFSRLRSGHMAQNQWDRIIKTSRAVTDAPLFIDDTPNPSLLEITSKARRLKVEHGLELIVLDYLQLMQAGGKYENRNLEIAAISRGMKQLAKELDIPVIALSQLSRNPERRSGADKRPQLADLRESGSIEQDADLVAFVFREEVYKPDDPEVQGTAELIIAKHRNGETGTVDLVFLGEITTFKTMDRFHHGDPPPSAPN